MIGFDGNNGSALYFFDEARQLVWVPVDCGLSCPPGWWRSVEELQPVLVSEGERWERNDK